VAGGGDVSQVMLQLFVPSNFQQLAAFLRKAYRFRFVHNTTADMAGQHINNTTVSGGGHVVDDGDSSSGCDSDYDSDDDLD
jgi:hypothetical protein